MAKYAATTSVPIARSVGELEQILERWGCDQFAIMKDDDAHVIGFRRRFDEDAPLIVRMTLPVGGLDPQAMRAALRALVMCVKAKMAAIDSGITTFEREFMPDLLLADGSTVEDHAIPQIESSRVNGELLSDGFRIGPSRMLENHQ